MSTEENKDIVLQFAEASLQRDQQQEILRELLAEDCVIHAFAREKGATPGFAAYIASSGDMARALPDLVSHIESVVAENDRVVIRTTLSGTHTEPFGPFSAAGPWRDFSLIAPTGRRITWSNSIEYRVTNGKVVEMWLLWDVLGFLQQLGYSPQPDPVTAS